MNFRHISSELLGTKVTVLCPSTVRPEAYKTAFWSQNFVTDMPQGLNIKGVATS